MDYYLTEERLAELKAELNDLKTIKRMEVAERLKRAKELGDLSENSEYIEAREEQRRVETRIVELEDMLKRAKIITKKEGGATVQIGSTIEVTKNGEMRHFTIVGSNEARPEEGKISNESPLGSAFLDKKVGQEVTMQTPAGGVVYRILRIE